MSKKIIGYKAPYEIYGHTLVHKISKGDILERASSFYYAKKDWPPTATPFHLAKEVVEQWEPVYETFTYKVGDYLMCEKDVRMDIDGRLEFTTGKLYLSEKSRCLTNNSGNRDHIMNQEFVNEHFRLATPEEVGPKSVQLTLGSKDDLIDITGGKITCEGIPYKLDKLQALVNSNSGQLGNIGDYGIWFDFNTRFIRIGCIAENHLFSLNEITQIIHAAEKQLR